MTKKILTYIIVMLPMLCWAQTDDKAAGNSYYEPSQEVSDSIAGVALDTTSPATPHLQSYYEPVGVGVLPPAYNDSVTVPYMTLRHLAPSWRYPFSWYGWGGWLHEGMNVSLSASVFTQTGKHAYHGVGFGQDISLLYATSLTDRLSVALGGYYNNVYWAHNRYGSAGLNALLNYRFNDKWEAFVYGQKSIMTDKFVPLPVYDMHALGDVVGGGVRYNITPSFTMEVSVSYGSLPSHREKMYDTYNDVRPK